MGPYETKWFRRFEEGGEGTAVSQSAPPLAELCSRDNCLLSEDIYIHTRVYTATAKRTERRYEWYFHVRRHIRDRINTVSAIVYVVSHIGVIYTRRSRVPKPSHSSQSFTFHFNRTITLSVRVFYLCKKKNAVLFARKKAHVQ